MKNVKKISSKNQKYCKMCKVNNVKQYYRKIDLMSKRKYTIIKAAGQHLNFNHRLNIEKSWNGYINALASKRLIINKNAQRMIIFKEYSTECIPCLRTFYNHIDYEDNVQIIKTVTTDKNFGYYFEFIDILVTVSLFATISAN